MGEIAKGNGQNTYLVTWRACGVGAIILYVCNCRNSILTYQYSKTVLNRLPVLFWHHSDQHRNTMILNVEEVTVTEEILFAAICTLGECIKSYGCKSQLHAEDSQIRTSSLDLTSETSRVSTTHTRPLYIKPLESATDSISGHNYCSSLSRHQTLRCLGAGIPEVSLSFTTTAMIVQGTIFPAPNFSPIADAQMLGGALQGFGCDKDLLIAVLTQRSNAQRLMIAEAYQSLLGRDLIGDLREKLSDHFKDVMVGLMYPPPSYDAHELWHAMKGAGTEENCLIDILASRTNGEIFQMREAYYLQYGSNLQEDIYSETSGHFRDTLMNLVQGTREEGYTDPAMAAQDAMVLWEACQQKTGEHKTMLQMILCNKSYQQLWLVFQEFQNISGQDIVDAINECYDGYFQELLVAIVLCVRDKPAYFAYRLYSAIHDFGFHNKTVIRTLIARSEIDLMTIRKRYKERYGKSLFHDIKNFASGHYEKALLAICAGDAEDY
nr:annexin A10 [Vulpes vulpes]